MRPMPPRRFSLIQSPTPLHRLDRVSQDLGIDLWIKRDDLTGFALGGNKGRKLEYLITQVQDSGADTVLTCGSRQSNFIRQLSAACAVIGVKLVAVVMDLPYEFELPPEKGLTESGGNVLLDYLLGAELRTIPNRTWEALFDATIVTQKELEETGRTVYSIPVGGSSPIGAYAFTQAAEEIATQAPAFDFIVTASSSGSTQTGLQYALNGSQTKLIGIACDPEPELVEEFALLAAGLDALTGESKNLQSTDFHFDTRFVGPGYGIPSEAGMDALRYLARREGIFLDPIYSAKAFAGLMELASEGTVKGRVLFWHTGGTPSLFAMQS
jgi:D-cysteine desulfhydrase family pyridoxal phosphate-dependent enzyme